MAINGKNYFGNHVGAPQILQGLPNYNVEVSEGQVPPGEFYPANYLPALIDEYRLAGSAYVLMPGKVVCLDENKRLVPAGLVAEIKKARGVAGYTYSGAATTYGDISVRFGCQSVNGAFAAASDEFVTLNSFGTSGAAAFKFSMPVGIMRYAALKSPGTDPSNPATFTQHSYDTGGARAFSRWCYIQVPVVETQSRTENITTGSASWRIALYPSGALTFGGGFSPTLKALPSLMSNPATGTTATQYCLIGRTIMFNGTTPVGATVAYTPTVNTPFTSLIMSSAVTGVRDLIGEAVSYDVNSNYVLAANKISPHLIGQVIDVKVGQNDDLKLVRTYFRDAGLWQEQPGSATDGRSTMLSIANAPKYIARIAVNFETLYQAYTA